jgi:hypothetical protein
MLEIRKKDSAAILQSLGGGVVPRTGLEHIVVGRKGEIEQFIRELNSIRDGAASTKFIIGDFGSGKTFLLYLFRHIALKQRFVVADADFTPERRLYASDGKAVALYTEMMKNLSTATKPDGGALQALIDRWVNGMQTQVVNEQALQGLPFNDPRLVQGVQASIRSAMNELEHLSGGYDFAEVINAYYRGYVEDNESLMRAALRWLRGEYSSRTDARRDLGVKTVIGDDNWYEYVKVMASFVTAIGYAGLVINLDEAINLYKISHSQNRAKNYELLLSIYNDTMQGKVSHLYALVGGTPEFLNDERRGLASYEALKSRLALNKFETEQFRDLTQPVIKLTTLRPEELLALMQKLRDIHASHYAFPPAVTDSELQGFLVRLMSRPGAQQFLTAREVVRTLLMALNILFQNPGMDKSGVFNSAADQAELAPPPVLPDIEDASSPAPPAARGRFQTQL